MMWTVLIFVCVAFIAALLFWKISVDSKRKELEQALARVLSVSAPQRAAMADKWRQRAMDDHSRPATLLRQSSAAYIASIDVASRDWLWSEASDTMQKMEWDWIVCVQKWLDFQKASGLFPEKTSTWQSDWSRDHTHIETWRRTANVWSCSYNILITSWWGWLWNSFRLPLTTWMDQKEHERLLGDLGFDSAE